MEYKWIFLPNYKNLKLGVFFRAWNRQLEYSYRNASSHDWKFTKFHIWVQDKTKISSEKEADLRWLNRFVDLMGLVYWKQANRCLYAFQLSIHWAPKSRLDSRWRCWIPPAHPTPLWGFPPSSLFLCPFASGYNMGWLLYTVAWEFLSWGQELHLFSLKLLPSI